MKGVDVAKFLQEIGCRIDAVSGEHIWVTNEKTGRSYILSPRELSDHTKEEVAAVLKGEREAMELKVISRVCGYYSYTHNWNQSKLGELDGRRKGNYGFGGDS